MLPWVVTFRRTLRRSRKSHSRCVLRHSPPTASGGMDCARRLSAPKSFPIISFTDPHLLTAIESYRYKNVVGQAAYHHPPYATHRSPMDSSPFFSYYYGLFCIMQNRISFIFKSFRTLCQKPPGVGGRSSFLQRSDVPTFRRSNDPPVPLRRTPLGATIGKGARNLRHPGKQLRSPQCLMIVSGHRGRLDLGPQRKSCLGPAF